MHPMLNGLSRGKKRKGKIRSLSFFPQPFFCLSRQQAMGLFHSICSQIQTVPIRTRCLCLLCRGKGHAHIIKSTGSRLLFFRAIARFALDAPMSRSQLPTVKYVYDVDYKSMIGGYRTLLVMNSVNPLLIPL